MTIKKKSLIIGTILLSIVILLAWAPWINDIYARNKVLPLINQNWSNFNPKPDDIYSIWLPGGKLIGVKEDELMWFVNFFGQVYDVTNMEWRHRYLTIFYTYKKISD